MHDHQLNPKRFLAKKLNQNLRMIQLDRVWLVVFAFQSPINLWLLDLLNYAGTCSNVHSCLWKNLHRVTDINRNWISEELLKLGRGQEICGRSDKFYFYRGGTFPMMGESNLLGGVSYPSAYYDKFMAKRMTIHLKDLRLQNSKEEKIIGIIIDYKQNFNNHIKNICRNTCQKVSALSRIASNLTMIEERFFLNSTIKSQFTYFWLI